MVIIVCFINEMSKTLFDFSYCCLNNKHSSISHQLFVSEQKSNTTWPWYATVHQFRLLTAQLYKCKILYGKQHCMYPIWHMQSALCCSCWLLWWWRYWGKATRFLQLHLIPHHLQGLANTTVAEYFDIQVVYKIFVCVVFRFNKRKSALY